MISYFEAPNEPDSDLFLFAETPRIFLAGGITHCPTWQDEALSLLKESGRDLIVYNPRRGVFDFNDPTAAWEQVSWEQRHLHEDGLHTLFWFPACDAALTTQPIALFELGQALGEGRPLTVGADPGYPRAADVEMLVRLNAPDLFVYDNLPDLVSVTIGRIL